MNKSSMDELSGDQQCNITIFRDPFSKPQGVITSLTLFSPRSRLSRQSRRSLFTNLSIQTLIVAEEKELVA